MRLYFDEDSMSRGLVRALRARGMDVVTALEAEMIERTDADHLEYAARQGRVLCTFNVGDFYGLHTEWISKGRQHAGIVLMPHAGLVTRQIPLVIPRAHDCITLFLGSRTRYGEQFRAQPGTYWYALDYVERSDGSMGLGAEADAETQAVYDEYIAKYGKDNADYLMEVVGAWRDHYDRAAFIDMGVGDSEAIEVQTQQIADQRGWTFERMAGNLVLIRRLLEGDWDDDFLVLEPGRQVSMTYDGDVIGAAEAAREQV
jgi:hypothetical protein